jgi:hypothetical protein
MLMTVNAQTKDDQVEQLPILFEAARSTFNLNGNHRSPSLTAKLSPAQIELINTLQGILERSVELVELQRESRRSYLRQLVEAYFRLFPRCLAGMGESELVRQSLTQTVQRLMQMPIAVIQDEYDRLNRQNYNLPLKQLVLLFSRPGLGGRQNPPPLSEAECLLALFIQCLRQQLGTFVLLSDRFRQEYRDLLRSVCAMAQDPEQCQGNLIGWLWEAMKSFDPLKAFSASGHGRPTFEAWVRTVVNNKLADEKRKLLKREADELLFYEPRALQVFQDRYSSLPSAVQAEFDLQGCLRLIQVVQTEVTDPRIRASTSRLRQRISQILQWSIEKTREVHHQVRRILGRYVQSTRSLNITSTDSTQEWIDNYPDARTLPNPAAQGLDCIVEFLNDEHTPDWVRDWCEKRRTQAEIARELFVSQPTISRCLGREYRLWLYRKFFVDAKVPGWMKRWYETQDISSPHQRRQLRREIHSEYAQGVYSAKDIDEQIENKLADWCDRNGIYYLP